jgi:hypothetical protein
LCVIWRSVEDKCIQCIESSRGVAAPRSDPRSLLRRLAPRRQPAPPRGRRGLVLSQSQAPHANAPRSEYVKSYDFVTRRGRPVARRSQASPSPSRCGGLSHGLLSDFHKAHRCSAQFSRVTIRMPHHRPPSYASLSSHPIPSPETQPHTSASASSSSAQVPRRRATNAPPTHLVRRASPSRRSRCISWRTIAPPLYQNPAWRRTDLRRSRKARSGVGKGDKRRAEGNRLLLRDVRCSLRSPLSQCGSGTPRRAALSAR